MSEDGYRVAIKPSAWRASAPVGRWVNRQGASRTFDSKALAREWARDAAGPGVTCWIQDAVPWDGSDADGYLVGTTERASERPADGRRQSRLVDDSTDA